MAEATDQAGYRRIWAHTLVPARRSTANSISMAKRLSMAKWKEKSSLRPILSWASRQLSKAKSPRHRFWFRAR